MAEIKLKIASVVIGSGEGGGSGVAPYYADLPDKPSINGETLSGDMTSEDLGLASSEQSVPAGGTTGQVLAKKSNADNDVQWVNQESGGTEVVANPSGQATTPLNKIKIGDTNYNIPQTDTSNLATKQELQQGLSGKQDIISDLQQIRTRADEGHTALQPIQDATPNNFVIFDENGGIKDSGKKDTDFATAAQGTKADNAIPMPTGTDGQILEKDSNETSGVKWVNKPSDGEDGASAYDLYEQAEIAAGRTPLSQEAWLASLKANIGTFKFVNYDGTAEAAFTTGGIGTPYSGTIDSLAAGTDTTPDVILLMNNTDGTTTPTKTFMISTQDDGNSGYEFVYAGDLQSAMPSNVLTQTNIVNDLTTGGATDVLSAEQGVVLGHQSIYDVSAKNPTAGPNSDGKWESLSALLSDANIDTLIPTAVRCGGMNIRFVQSSDNKYVEYLYNSTSTNADNFTNVDNWEKLNLEKEVDDLETSVNNLNNAVQSSENDSLYITDKDGNVVAQIDDTGIKSIDFKDENGNSLVGAIADNKESIESTASDVEQIQHSVQDKEQEELDVTDIDGNIIIKVNEQGAESVDFIARGRHLKDAPLAWYEDTLYVTDSNGNVVAKIDANGLNVVNVEYFGKVSFDWIGKSIATYGDSVTAINNGDFEYPFSDTSNNWGNKVADYFKFAKHYGRGIGGQRYKWGSAGGSVCWVTPTGIPINRLDSFNYDNWDGTTYPSRVTAEMEQQGTAIRIRGCLASWLRITKMFPADMKDSVDVVLVMAHNDSYDSNDCAFVENDTTDTEWAASGNDYYDKINGDYNLDTFKGAVASCIMKLQLWMPNAVIVLMSGISGQGVEGELNLGINNTSGLNKAEAIRNMSKLTSIPCIDTYATDGINGWNRLYYIADSIHPYTAYGKNMFARAVIGGLKCILPKDKVIIN